MQISSVSHSAGPVRLQTASDLKRTAWGSDTGISPVDHVRSNGRFYGAVAGAAAGLGIALAGGVGGSLPMLAAYVGTWAGSYLGGAVQSNAPIPQYATPLPGPVAAAKGKMGLIGALAGAGVGLAVSGGSLGAMTFITVGLSAMSGHFAGKMIQYS